MMGKVKFGRLMANPHGVKAGDIEFGSVLRKLATPSRRIELAPEEIVQEAQRAVADGASATRPRLLLISGERSPHTKNSNLRGLSSLTARQSENFARINPEDAAALSIQDREIVEIATANGSLRIRARIADDIRAGVVSVGHGWGRALFQPEQGLAVEVKGSNANVLTGTDALDRLTGMPMYNAIACSMRRVDQSVSAKGK
jgi:anaerobic selenocysteine-containing dehydrogenase